MGSGVSCPHFQFTLLSATPHFPPCSPQVGSNSLLLGWWQDSELVPAALEFVLPTWKAQALV